MATEKRLIDVEQAKRATYEEIFWTESEQAVVRNFLARLPKVYAYTEEQVDSIIQKADLLEIENRNLEQEVDWLKNCLNCEIRKDCPRHCGKVVHGCDHWEYGDSTVDAVEVVHGRWRFCGSDRWNDAYVCSECGKMAMDDSNYCPNCGAKMDGDGNESV